MLPMPLSGRGPDPRASDRHRGAPRLRCLAGTLVAVLLVTAFPLAAAELEIPVVVKAKRVVAEPGRVIENGQILVRGGVIEQIGATVDVPTGAEVLEFENLTVYPGLIEGYHERSFPERDEDDEEVVELGHESDLIQPERDVARVPVEEDTVKKLRNAGFTLVVGYPDRGILRGTGVVQTLGDGSLRENLLETGVAMAAGLDQTGDGYPGSLMGSMALLRQVVLDARWYADALARWERDPAQRRPDLDLSLAALGPVVSGELPVVFETDDAQSALRVLTLLDELDLHGILLGSGQEYQRLEEIVAAELPILLPVDYPDAPTVDDLDDRDPSLVALRHWKEAPENPGRLVEAGATVAFTSHGLSSPGDLFANLARSIEAGTLTQDEALAALTVVPAELYGLDGVAGTLEAGKMANFLLAEGDLFVDKPKIQEIWVEGRRYELEEIKPPEVNPVGQWTVNVDSGGQQIETELSITGSEGAYDGSLSAMGIALPLSDVTVSGKTAIITLDASGLGGGDFVLRMTIDGDSGSGTGESPMGAFSFSAERTSSTPEEGGTR